MSVSSPLMRKLSSASKLPLTAEAVRVAAVSKRWQPNLQGRMFFCMLKSSKLSLIFTNFHLTLFLSHYHIVVTFIILYWYWFFLHFYGCNWCWYVFLFLLTSWPCTKCQCQTKTGCKSSSISCSASLLCTQALPSSCCCFETLTHTQGYELLMTQWQCLVPYCCWGCCIHQWSFQIYMKLPCVGLIKSALRFTKRFKREKMIFYDFLCG